MDLKHLGAKVPTPEKPSKDILDTFPNPGAGIVTLETSEFTSLCPVTGQPDFVSVIVIYKPNELCLESKSLKLYLQSYRNEKGFMEALCARIYADLVEVLNPAYLSVSLNSAPRGGISLRAERWSSQ